VSAESAALPLFFRLSQNDIDAVFSIETACFPVPWDRAIFECELEREVCLAIGMNVEGVLAGYSFSNVYAGELHILSLAVRPDLQKNGFGSALLAEVLGAGKKAGSKVAFLEVRRSNDAARTLYEKFGFSLCGVRKAYYSNNSEDAFIFTLSLE
jgi:[ribosomal protein S18]-alanine N-acetyltransferase